MNKKQKLDIKIIRAKMHAQEAIKKYEQAWYSKEPLEVNSGEKENNLRLPSSQETNI